MELTPRSWTCSGKFCPSSPKIIKDKGLTFLWNDSLNGKDIDGIRKKDKAWLLVELNAIGGVDLGKLCVGNSTCD